MNEPKMRDKDRRKALQRVARARGEGTARRGRDRLDEALSDAVRQGALAPAEDSAPAPQEVWLAAFGAAVAWQVSRECNRGVNVVEAFDPAAGGTLSVEGVADHASAVAEMAVKAFLAVGGL